EERPHQPERASFGGPLDEAPQGGHDREQDLHPGGARVARRPLSCGELRPAGQSRGVLDEVDVEGGPREQGAREGGDDSRHYCTSPSIASATSMVPTASLTRSPSSMT